METGSSLSIGRTFGISCNFGGGRHTSCLVPVMGSPTNGAPSPLSTESRCQVFPVAAASLLSYVEGCLFQTSVVHDARGKRHNEIVQRHKTRRPTRGIASTKIAIDPEYLRYLMGKNCYFDTGKVNGYFF